MPRRAQGSPNFRKSELVSDDVEYGSDYRSKYLVLAAIVLAVLVSAVVTILVSASETFTEVVTVIVQAHVVRIVTKTRILVTIGVMRIESPSILTVGLTCVEAFFVPAIDRVAKHLSAVAACVVVAAAPIVPVIVYQVVVVPSLLQTKLIQSDPLPVTLLVTKIRQTPLSLQFLLTPALY